MCQSGDHLCLASQLLVRLTSQQGSRGVYFPKLFLFLSCIKKKKQYCRSLMRLILKFFCSPPQTARYDQKTGGLKTNWCTEEEKDERITRDQIDHEKERTSV